MVKLSFPSKTIVEVLSGIWINLTSIYFGAILVSPGFFGSTGSEFFKLLLANLPSAVLNLVVTIVLVEKAKKLI